MRREVGDDEHGERRVKWVREGSWGVAKNRTGAKRENKRVEENDRAEITVEEKRGERMEK